MIRANRERILDPKDAVAIAHAEYARLGLRGDLTELAGSEYGIAQVIVKDLDGGYVNLGGGKGVGIQCHASALFEGLEHYWLDHGLAAAQRSKDDVTVLPIEEIAGNPAAKADRVLERLAVDVPGARVRCLRFDRVCGAQDVLWYPAFLRNPYTQRHTSPPDDQARFASYLRYGSGNGTASGITEDDAFLHALMEVIERDAVSLALLHWFVPAARAYWARARPSIRRMPWSARSESCSRHSW